MIIRPRDSDGYYDSKQKRQQENRAMHQGSSSVGGDCGIGVIRSFLLLEHSDTPPI
jgi:hypothetical protein